MTNRKNLIAVAFIVAAVSIACNMSTANMSSFTSSKDSDGKQETTTFKAGETLYANAVISNAPGKTTTKIYVQDDKGKTVTGTEVKVELASSGIAKYSLPLPAGVSSGKYKLIAEMMDESGEKKDSKSIDISIEGAPAGSNPTDDSGDDADDDKGGDKKDDK